MAVRVDLPVHAGLGDARRVDVEVTDPAAGRREMTRMPGINVSVSRTLVLKTR